VLPTDKSRLVRLAQQTGLVTGMTGDGVNDAPALRIADVGFAMGSGTQVAKDAGDILILDDDIASIAKAVLYGRTIFRSIQRFVVFQLTVNFCAVAISLLGPFIGIETPVTVVQMLWINLSMDTLAGLAFAGEPPDARRMAEPPKPRDARILTRSMLGQILHLAASILLLCLGFLTLPAVRIWFPTETAWLTGFFALFVFCGIAAAFCARTETAHLLRGLLHNPSFLGIMTTVAAVQLGLLYLGGDLFRTHGLTLSQLELTAALALAVIPLDLLGKGLRSGWKSFTMKARTPQRRTVL
jgi:magnesium-transporting ATPase (P-type)